MVAQPQRPDAGTDDHDQDRLNRTQENSFDPLAYHWCGGSFHVLTDLASDRSLQRR